MYVEEAEGDNMEFFKKLFHQNSSKATVEQLIDEGRPDEAVEQLSTLRLAEYDHDEIQNLALEVVYLYIDELVQIGSTDGFLASKPGGKYNSEKRHIRARVIGEMISKIAESVPIRSDTEVVSSVSLMGMTINEVQKRLGYGSGSSELRWAWHGVGGWLA